MLDDKLKKILREFNYYKGAAAEPDTIVQIKKCFADEGYKPYSIYTKITQQDSETTVERGLPVVTGQEWYERFEKENKITPEDALEMYSDNAYETLFAMSKHSLEAAKRAAGIKDKEIV